MSCHLSELRLESELCSSQAREEVLLLLFQMSDNSSELCSSQVREEVLLLLFYTSYHLSELRSERSASLASEES